ncbi:MAG: hypothetical protein K0S74_411 [Chlamydiales bacterium]|jgi:hypothetical protein|nr:hypothetical protein [Chlamydiales bacterium]
MNLKIDLSKELEHLKSKPSNSNTISSKDKARFAELMQLKNHKAPILNQKSKSSIFDLAKQKKESSRKNSASKEKKNANDKDSLEKEAAGHAYIHSETFNSSYSQDNAAYDLEYSITGSSEVKGSSESKELMSLLAQRLIERIDLMKQADTQEITLYISDFGKLGSFNITITQYSTAPRQYNLFFNGLSEEAQRLIEESKIDFLESVNNVDFNIHKIETERNDSLLASNQSFDQQGQQGQQHNSNQQGPHKELSSGKKFSLA